ncbi:hypothetical protein BRC71_05890 [Halobacteriales archaeon QH_7_65_31]|nr:MAG: hypothetical protein BRC71_05890 [Halobacteriales archaeon QH_7_65_31]PSQ31515.1 MAG: hypothetical protein BRD16_03050 [Halobacteriales archaeon SW_6_65_46]
MPRETEGTEHDGGLREHAVEQFSKPLSKSGSSDGVALHIDSSTAKRYGLDPDTKVDVRVVEIDGDIEFRIGNIPAGFTLEDLETFADSAGWEQTDRYADDSEWYLTYRNPTGNVRIEIDSEAWIAGSAANNVEVETDPIDVTGDIDRYRQLQAVAHRKHLRVSVDDSEGNWQRLRSSPNYETDDGPDPETLEQLSTRGTVSAKLVCYRTSLNTSLQELQATVSAMESALAEIAPEN